MSITGHSRKVTFRSGGFLYVGLENMVLGDWGENERELFSRIADAMNDYERKVESPVAVGAVDPVGGRGTERPRATKDCDLSAIAASPERRDEITKIKI
jgi:hypothetical protein